MRKLLIPFLLASVAATPALADPGDHHHDRQDGRPEHQDRADRPERPAPTERPHFDGQRNFDRANNRDGGAQAQQYYGRSERFQQNVQQPNQAQIEAFRAERERMRGSDGQANDGRREWRGQQRDFDGARSQQVEQSRNGTWTRRGSQWNGQSGYYGQRQDVQRQMRERSRWANGGWDRDWRNDHRYDWRSYRDRHRSRFHLGVYFDPFGYGYRPFGIGYQLMPAYFGQRYWIDPGLYGLPYAPPGTQWVRYWNDALLVDLYTGEVIDVINGFFW